MSPKRRIAGLRAVAEHKNFFCEDFPLQLSIETFLPLSKSSQWPTDIVVQDIGEIDFKKHTVGFAIQNHSNAPRCRRNSTVLLRGVLCSSPGNVIA